MKVPGFQIIPGMVDFRIISPDVNILSLRSHGFALLFTRILTKPQFYIISLLKWLLWNLKSVWSYWMKKFSKMIFWTQGVLGSRSRNLCFMMLCWIINRFSLLIFIWMMGSRLIMQSLRGWWGRYEKVSSPLTQTISGTTDTLLMVKIYNNMTKINSGEI